MQSAHRTDAAAISHPSLPPYIMLAQALTSALIAGYKILLAVLISSIVITTSTLKCHQLQQKLGASEAVNERLIQLLKQATDEVKKLHWQQVRDMSKPVVSLQLFLHCIAACSTSPRYYLCWFFLTPLISCNLLHINCAVMYIFTVLHYKQAALRYQARHYYISLKCS
jgi:hypothetical protein